MLKVFSLVRLEKVREIISYFFSTSFLLKRYFLFILKNLTFYFVEVKEYKVEVSNTIRLDIGFNFIKKMETKHNLYHRREGSFVASILSARYRFVIPRKDYNLRFKNCKQPILTLTTDFKFLNFYIILRGCLVLPLLSYSSGTSKEHGCALWLL